jgi:hypothetical protein
MKNLYLLLFSFLLLNFTKAQNLVSNGDFSLGNTSFTTGYILDCTVGGAIGEARYCVGTNPNAVHFAWTACGDHTTGNGNMMILNGTSTPNVIVWEQQPVTVTPNTCYQFCVWATSVYPGNPGKIKLIVNGATQAFTQLSPTTCVWQQICGTWNSGASTTATLTIIDEDLNPGGNDLAIDDISFTQISTPCTITLPLNWRYVKSASQGSNNIVEWAIDNDVNNANFLIEKSSDGIVFNAIGTVAKNSLTSYTFTDNTTKVGVTYYRIKQVDTDGRYSYSSITKVYNNGKASTMSIAENPVNDIVKLKINAKKEIYSLQIFNAIGSNVYKEKIMMQSDYMEKNIPAQNLSNGIYFIKLINSRNENIAIGKFIKK